MPTPIEPDITGTIDQLTTRLNEIFPDYGAGAWPPLEKNVFDGLLATVVQRHGCAAVTPGVLYGLRCDADDIVRRYRTAQSGQ